MAIRHISIINQLDPGPESHHLLALCMAHGSGEGQIKDHIMGQYPSESVKGVFVSDTISCNTFNGVICD